MNLTNYTKALSILIKLSTPFVILLLFVASISIHAQNKTIEQVFYFTGNTELEQGDPTQKILKAITEMSKLDQKATFVAIGNITQNGYSPKGKDSKQIEDLLQKSVMQPLKDFNGNVIFMPGKNEWNKNGHEDIDDMESFIQDNSKVKFWPNDGCAREQKDLDMKNVTLLMIDSQWFLEDWDNHLYINTKCGIKSRDEFFAKFKDDMKDEQNKTVIVAIHHSILTNSRQDFFENIGGLSKEDYYSTIRQKMAGTLETFAGLFPNVIFVSASDKNLQYIEDDGIHQIISGAATSKLDNVRHAKAGQFTSKTNGFARLTVYSDNSSKVEFFATSDNAPQKLFETDIRDEQTKLEEVSYHDMNSFGTTFKSSVYTKEETDKSGIYKLFWGDHYRDIYSKMIEAPVLNLDKLPNNVRAISEGGGNQSSSIRLIDDEDNEFTAREVRKSATRFIQSKITEHDVRELAANTIAEDIVQDFYTTAHPYAPFALNPIFDRLDIYNAEPKIYYLPKQERLGIFNKDYGDKLYMFEAHVGSHSKSLERFGNSDDIVSTADVLELTQNSKTHQVDESNFLKVRLMDFVIGDYDRHDDQWRWAAYEQADSTTLYKTIRRDRDQAFPRYDGLILGILKIGMIDFRSMEPYDEDVNSVKWMSRYAYPLDQAFLKNTTWEDWKAQVDFIQENLTDSVIDEAFKTLPKEVQDETIEDIIKAFKARRDNLTSIAERYYEFLMRHQIILGTEEKDEFIITRKPNGETTISLTTEKNGSFERTYNKDLTKEIWIYGLDDEDTFKIVGDGDHYIPLKILGGENNDIYDFETTKKVKVYDYKSKKNTFVNPATRKWLVDSYDINTYDDAARKLDAFKTMPAIGFNSDTGISAGLSGTYTTYGLADNPFASEHTLTAQFFTATNGFELKYASEFAHIFYNWNFGVKAHYTSPNYAINYFGTGNETMYDEDAVDLEYNRVRIRQRSVAPSLIYRKERVQLSIGPLAEAFDVEQDLDGVTGQEFLASDTVFNNQAYAGAEAAFQYKNKSGEISFIRRGFQFDVIAGYKTSIDTYDNEFAYLKPSVSVVYPLHHSGACVLATKVGAHMNFGDTYEFYHGATLGGTEDLRGFRNERFNGQSAFFQSTDLRVGVTQFKTNFIPIRLGLSAGFDYGRVWVEDDNSQKWHNSYGGSIFINGFKALTANIGYYMSDESNRLLFSLGFKF